MDDTDTALDTLIGSASTKDTVPKTGDDNVDYKKLYEESQKKLHSEQVEAGRLRKKQEEVDRLKAENEELKKNRETDDLLSSISDDEDSEDVPEEWMRSSAKIASKAAEKARSYAEKAVSEQKAALENEIKRNRDIYNRAFVESINNRFPGFLKSVKIGGDKRSAWELYLKPNAESINAAIERHDFDTLSYHIKNFYENSLNVRVPSGRGEAAPTPEPSHANGVINFNDGGNNGKKVYTQDEVLKIFDDIEKYRCEGDYAKVKELSEEIKKAEKENRIK